MKNLIRPYLEPNQLKKLIKGKCPSSINNVIEDQKLQTKEFFIIWIENSSLFEGNPVSFLPNGPKET